MPSIATPARQAAALDDITFVILTHNEEARLPDCLRSLEGISCKLFVVDSFSEDGTLEILRSRGIIHAQHRFERYGDQRNWAQQSNPHKTPWIFHLDADERISDALRHWLLQEFPGARLHHDGFQFSRRTVFMGKWIRWGGHYPTFHLRLFKSALGRCEAKAYDQHFVVDGDVASLAGKDIVDIVASDLGSFVRSHDRWAAVEAAEIVREARRGEVNAALFGNPLERRRWLKVKLYERLPLLLRPFIYFFYRYFLRLGFLDGREGLIFHVLQGFWFRFLVDAKVVELKKRRANN